MFKWLWGRKRKTHGSSSIERTVIATSAVAEGNVGNSESTIDQEDSLTCPDPDHESATSVPYYSQASEFASQPSYEEMSFETDCFKLVRQVLEKLSRQIADASGEAHARDSIRNAVYALYKNYNNESAYKRVGYAGTSTHFAYLYSYAPGRASVLYQIMNELQRLAELVSRQTLNITSFGGGPGTDVLGVLKLRLRRNGASFINATIYDKEPGWESVWRLIETEKGTTRYARVNFHFGDMLDPDWGVHEPWNANLAILSYSLSELGGQQSANAFLSKVIEAANSGTLFVIVDNKHSHIINPVEEAVNKGGLIKLCPTQYKRMEVEHEEWNSAKENRDRYKPLDEVRGHNGYPQRHFNLAYWILQKP